MSDSLQSHGLQPSGLPCPQDFQARILEWVAISLGDLPDPGMETASLALASRFFTTESPEKPDATHTHTHTHTHAYIYIRDFL